MKPYSMEQIEELMKSGQKIDLSRVDMGTLNKVATNYLKDLEKGETKARECYLKELLKENCDPVKTLAWLQLFDFTKNSKEAVKYNFVQFENKIKQYNASIDAKNNNEKKS